LGDLEKAVGQYLICKSWLRRRRPTWEWYLAVRASLMAAFADDAIQVVITNDDIKLVSVDIDNERIVRWS
jgi:hypothetical protein